MDKGLKGKKMFPVRKAHRASPKKAVPVRPMHEADFMAIAGFYIRGMISEVEKDELMRQSANWYAKHPNPRTAYPKSPKGSAKAAGRSRQKTRNPPVPPGEGGGR